ncbi:MAG: HupE/UreJ family protein [Candidatus Eremiobacterota bacterium]
MRLRLLVLLLALLFLAAEAHWTDDAAMQITVQGSQANCVWQFAGALAKFADDDGDGRLSQAELTRHQDELLASMRGKLELRSGASPARLRIVEQPGTEPSDTHYTVLLQAAWDAPVHDFELLYDFWAPQANGPKCLVVLQHGESTRSTVLTPMQTRFKPAASGPSGNFFLLGMEHIYTGYDHVLFLIALLLPGGSLMTLVKTVTAFTLAHSVTLSLSVLGIVSLPSRLVESVIAFSILVAALMNLQKRDNHRRWPLALGFGLIHGLGFASVLSEHGVKGTDALVPLLSFNLGVEAGQLTIVLVAFPALAWLHRQSFDRKAVVGLSLATALLALFWFVERLLG